MWMPPIINKSTKLIKEIEDNSKKIVKYLSVDIGDRTLSKYNKLQNTREYINKLFVENDIQNISQIYEEKYIVNDLEVANIIAEIQGEKPEDIIIVGAHYDTVEDSPGADDNATAIACLLQLHKLMLNHKTKKTIRFIAFTLEEPPFFSTPKMGSMIHATNCYNKNENIELMICLDMLGFGGKKIPQDYPLYQMTKSYPKYGDFLTVVSLPSASKYAHKVKDIMNKYAKTKVYEMIGPASIPGINLSDHYSFHKFNYPAIMLTDTAFYRNKNYHTENDTFETINFKFLSENIYYIYNALKELSNIGDILNE